MPASQVKGTKRRALYLSACLSDASVPSTPRRGTELVNLMNGAGEVCAPSKPSLPALDRCRTCTYTCQRALKSNLTRSAFQDPLQI